MKRTNKKLLGFLGLTAVAAITTFAAFLPTPGAQAIGSVTDTVTVRVVGPEADVEIIRPNDGADFIGPNQTIEYDYTASRFITVTLKYTNPDGVTTTQVIQTLNLDYESGTGSVNLNLDDPQYGYGDYVVIVKSEGTDGVFKEDAISFSYYPLIAEAEQDGKDEGKVDVALDYDDGNENIDKIVINVYDEDGNLIEGLSPAIVNPPAKDVVLDFGSYGLEPGLYTITATAYDAEGNALYRPYVTRVQYDIEEKAVPNTGSIFKNTNIAQTDYLITGLIIFGLTAVAGVIVIMKNGRREVKRHGRNLK